MKISIFTPSYNKGLYTIDGIKSVLTQTHGDFEYLISDHSDDGFTNKLIADEIIDSRVTLDTRQFTSEEMKKEFVGSVLINEGLPKLTGDIIIYKSDDDTLAPDCFDKISRFFKTFPDAKVCWFSMKVSREQPQGGFTQIADIKADRNIGLGTQWPKLDCMIDGGQIAYRRECLEKVTQPYYSPDWLLASHADGGFMDQLAKFYTFYPLSSDYLIEHRRTKLSTFTNDQTP